MGSVYSGSRGISKLGFWIRSDTFPMEGSVSPKRLPDESERERRWRVALEAQVLADSGDLDGWANRLTSVIAHLHGISSAVTAAILNTEMLSAGLRDLHTPAAADLVSLSTSVHKALAQVRRLVEDARTATKASSLTESD